MWKNDWFFALQQKRLFHSVVPQSKYIQDSDPPFGSVPYPTFHLKSRPACAASQVHRFTPVLDKSSTTPLHLHCTLPMCVCVCVLACTSHPRLISIFPPVCRNIAKQTFLETLQDNLIEMDVLASAHRDASFNDGYVARLLSSLLFRQCQPLALSVYACACSPSNSVCVYRTVKFTQTLSKWDVLFGVKH